MKTVIKIMVGLVAAMLLADQYNRNKPKIKKAMDSVKSKLKTVITEPEMHSGEVVTEAVVVETIKV